MRILCLSAAEISMTEGGSASKQLSSLASIVLEKAEG